MKKKLSRLEIKQAILSDHRFRELFPELQDDINSVLKNPTCACNIPLLNRFFNYKDRLIKYFGNRTVDTLEDDGQNSWTVIDCHVSDLEKQLNKLHKFGKKQVAVARYEDKVVVIINDIGLVV